MRIAVLSKKHLARRPYDRWLGRPGVDVLVFASDEDPAASALRDQPDRFASFALFDNWRTSCAIDEALILAHKTEPIDRIVALSESDIVRAAHLRSELGLAGQSPLSARAYRDKRLMKRFVKHAGIAVPDHAPLDDPEAFRKFATQNKGPVVIKPAGGSGAVGIRVFPEPTAIDLQAAGANGSPHGAQGWIAEEYIDAPMLSVDGLMSDGRVVLSVVSKYTNTCLCSVQHATAHGLLQLPDSHATALRAASFTQDIVDALPQIPGITSFHCELFDSPKRGLLFCEIACRTGGGGLNDMSIMSRGVDLDEWTCLGQADLQNGSSLPACPPAPPLYGDIMIPHPGGTLIHAPERCDIPGVVSFSVHPAVGQSAPKSEKVSQAAAQAIFQAPNFSTLEAAYIRARDWFDEELCWEQ